MNIGRWFLKKALPHVLGSLAKPDGLTKPLDTAGTALIEAGTDALGEAINRALDRPDPLREVIGETIESLKLVDQLLLADEAAAARAIVNGIRAELEVVR